MVPAKYYQQVGPDGFKRRPIGAGPYKLTSHEAGVKLVFEAFDQYYKPVHIKTLTMVAVPEAAFLCSGRRGAPAVEGAGS